MGMTPRVAARNRATMRVSPGPYTAGGRTIATCIRPFTANTRASAASLLFP